MVLSFKRQFRLFVWEGSKTHTIRAKQKNGKPRGKPGDTCHCFTGMRTKQCELIGRWRCSHVQEIRISFEPTNKASQQQLVISIDGVPMDAGDMNEFAWRDGFRKSGRECALIDMVEFWIENHNLNQEPLVGELIHWEWSLAARAAA